MISPGDTEGEGRAQDCEVFIRSRTESNARQLRQDVTGETVRREEGLRTSKLESQFMGSSLVRQICGAPKGRKGHPSPSVTDGSTESEPR